MFESTSQWSDIDGTSRYVSFAGCFLASTLNVTGAADRLLPRVRFNASNPSNFTAECGAFCGLHFVSEAKGEGQFVINGDGHCECVMPNSFMTPRSHLNFSAPCPPPVGGAQYVRLFEVAPRCPLNVSDCSSGDKCQVRDDCCVFVEDDKYEVPRLYIAMVQWTIVAILCIAVLEAIIYSCFRCRYRNGLGDQHGFEGDAELRTKSEAEELSTRLMSSFPPAPVPAPSMINNMEAPTDSCVICLEDLDTLPSSKLPCGHVLHCHCLKEYLSHKFTNRNTVPCPMCRTTIASESL